MTELKAASSDAKIRIWRGTQLDRDGPTKAVLPALSLKRSKKGKANITKVQYVPGRERTSEYSRNSHVLRTGIRPMPTNKSTGVRPQMAPAPGDLALPGFTFSNV